MVLWMEILSFELPSQDLELEKKSTHFSTEIPSLLTFPKDWSCEPRRDTKSSTELFLDSAARWVFTVYKHGWTRACSGTQLESQSPWLCSSAKVSRCANPPSQILKPEMQGSLALGMTYTGSWRVPGELGEIYSGQGSSA